MNKLEIFQEVYGKDYVFTETELSRLLRIAELIVQECIQQLEIGKKCDPYTGELFTCEHNDNIDYQIKVLKEHFGLELPEKFQTHVHASDTSSERVDETGKRKHG